jgi:hypothetical protein
MKTIDMTGTTLNGVLVLAQAESRQNRASWLCRCACGANFNAVGTALRLGKTKSCSHCSKLTVKKAVTKHGLVGTREYNSYNAMKARCLNPLDKRYSRYGGRGISICSRWLDSFPNFIEDMGMQPSRNHSIERVDRDKGYEPENCVWASMVEQANNRSNNNLIEIDGRTQTITQWSRETGVNRTVILRRMKKGFSGTSLIQKGILK